MAPQSERAVDHHVVGTGHVDDEERLVTLELFDRLARTHDAVAPVRPDVHLDEIAPAGLRSTLDPDEPLQRAAWKLFAVSPIPT